MASMKRHRTRYPGVYYLIGKKIGENKPERIYYVSYYRNGKRIEERAGRQFKDDMTPARAARIRAAKIDGSLPTNQERRDAEKALKRREAEKWTIDRLWNEYRKGRTQNSALVTDQNRYEKYIKPNFGKLEPSEILSLDVDRLRIKLLKRLKPATVRHVLSVLTVLSNYGMNNNLCQPLPFKVKKPKVNNLRAEYLTSDELERLFEAIERDGHPQAGSMMLMALYSGMRRGEMFKLQWQDIDFNRGFITIRDPKGGTDQKIPLNPASRKLLRNHPQTSEYVFPGRGGGQRVDINKQVNRIKKTAGLPKDFRPLHGLRHTFASSLANSGQVDMYQLQKLLTHKSLQMTQRYSHLRDEALRKASDLAADIFQPKVKKTAEVVDFETKR